MDVRLSPPCWLTDAGPDGDVAVSSRCRIARNLADAPFPWRADALQRKQAAGAILDAAARGGGPLAEAQPVAGDTLADEEADRLVEWRYASRDWVEPGPHRFLLVGEDRRTSLLVHEEDHLRLQAILPGLLVESAVDAARDAERRLAGSLAFARSEGIGFLTASPSNAGTGMRASALLHLAGLAASDSRDAVLEAAAEVGCAVRGLYGEGTTGAGELFQVSNTATYGTDVARTVERVASAARYLVAAEREARRAVFGTREGRARLQRATDDALAYLFEEEAAPRRLLPLASILRLAVAEGLLDAPIEATAEWVALAGVEAAESGPAERTAERFEAVRRTASLRQRLRGLVRATGAR